MTYETLRYEVADGILTLTLNRPDQLNAFTVTMADELVHAFKRASEDDEVRAIVVTGAGRAFCAGMDLSVPGNVFGLDENQRPSVADMHERLEDPANARIDLLDRVGARPVSDGEGAEPVPIRPGELGHWSDDDLPDLAAGS